MATPNYNLPTITGNMTPNVVRDMNALAEATDAAIKEAVDGVDLSQVTQEITAVKTDLATHKGEEASLTGKGHVQLSDSVTNSSTSTAATSNAVKKVNDIVIKKMDYIALDKSSGASYPDPNVELDAVFITNHANVQNPGKSNEFWYVEQIFYNAAGTVNSRSQIARSYNGLVPDMKTRHFYNGTWSPWSPSFQSVSSGKAAVANATTQMGVQTEPDAEFATIAANILKISTKPKTANGATTSNQYGTVQINGLGFNPTYVKLVFSFAGSERVQHFFYPIFGAPYVDGNNTVYPTYGYSTQISTAYAPNGMYTGGFQLPIGVLSSLSVTWLATDGILF